MRVLRYVSGKGLFAVAVWGASFVATRVALESFNPFGLVAIRLWAGMLLLSGVLLARRGPLLPARRDVLTCVLLGCVLSVHLLMQAYGLKHTTAIHTGWIMGFIPVTIALGAHLLGQQRIGRVGWTGAAVGTAGVLTVMMSSPPNFHNARWGDLLQVVSCLTWTVYTLAGTGPVARNGVLRVTTFGMAVAAVVVSGAMLATGVLSAAVTWRAVVTLVFLGPICNGVAYYMWFAALDEHGPARVGSLLYIEPFVALVTGALLLAEPVTAHAIVGGVCVLFGVWLVAHGSRRPAAAAMRN